MRGFVFSLDILIAILLLSLFLVQINNLFASALTIDTWKDTELQKQAEDILNILYYRGDLESFNQTKISNSLQEALPIILGARIQVDVYNPSIPPVFNTTSVSFATDPANASEVVQSRRPFVVFYVDGAGSTRILYSGLAKIWLWVK